jgi:hypothetical protein
LEDAIVFEEIERFDPPQPEDDRIKKGEDFLGDTIAVVPLGKSEMTIEEDAEVDFVNKFLEEGQTAKMSQTPSRKFDF